MNRFNRNLSPRLKTEPISHSFVDMSFILGRLEEKMRSQMVSGVADRESGLGQSINVVARSEVECPCSLVVSLVRHRLAVLGRRTEMWNMVDGMARAVVRSDAEYARLF